MNLARTQLLSIITKGITTALGIAQSIIIVRILSPAEFGLTGLVMSIGSVIGVSQHLGIVDGAIREIAVRKNKRHIALVSWVAHLVRQSVTLPLSLGLFLAAPFIADSIYGRPEIVPYIQIFAAALIFQGLQDVLGATLTGMKRFKQLYVVQIITAAINIPIFGFLTWQYGIGGFFWAIVVTTLIMVMLMGVDAVRALTGHLSLPSRSDIKQFGRAVLRVGAYMYLARIFFVLWQRSPLLILGGVLAADQLGYLNISMTFGSRLTILAMALSEVNLAWMSSLFVDKPDEFRMRVTKNMHRVFIFMLGITAVLLFFTPEILRYIIGAEYLPAESIIYLMTTAFFLYSLLDIGTSSLFVPANNPRQRAVIFIALTAVTGVILLWLLLSAPSALLASAGMLAGAVVSYFLMLFLARQYGVTMISASLLFMLVLLAGSVAWLLTNPALPMRIVVFALFALYVGWESVRNKLLPNVAELLASEADNNLSSNMKIICFAGGFYDSTMWTNRQHIMSRISKQHPVLYVEPRVWILRHMWRSILHPSSLMHFLQKLIWWQKKHDGLYTIAQWNIIPGSRESKVVSHINHVLNRYSVLLKARLLGFSRTAVVWIYDTEAAEYLSAFPQAHVVYDCVDDHAAQAGVDRNSQRVGEEEQTIMSRAQLVTVTSHKLFELKKRFNPNTQLVLNAGDVEHFLSPAPSNHKLYAKIQEIKTHGPVLGSVGALDSYKVDFDLLLSVAQRMQTWQFVFIGKPVVDTKIPALQKFQSLKNVHVLGQVHRQDVPPLVHLFDVCLIPYKHSRYNSASFPLKFWEFMATGKPLIVSGLPELKPYEPLSKYVKSAEEFITATKAELAGANENAMKRIKLSKQHSWEKRTQQLLHLLNQVVS
ncbi:MAG: oligosaccharide flippase family protein [Candidatus Andersenbacteria bacterium]|nr:oligosaccharide flippase family protein [Candidatus Andersenbacteria bacterium]MBI3250292.1 oligosaccharide flippase family protein [Candidatus Andersenbacteria bacterium]